MDPISENALSRVSLQENENENRYLKETIIVLRNELEKNKAIEEANIQKTIASATMQVDQLKEMISALRQQMEQLQVENSKKEQEIGLAYQAEIKQLKLSIVQIRTELEKSK